MKYGCWGRPGRQRRLIARLRITRRHEELLGAVRPLFPDADSTGELDYRLWRRRCSEASGGSHMRSSIYQHRPQHAVCLTQAKLTMVHRYLLSVRLTVEMRSKTIANVTQSLP